MEYRKPKNKNAIRKTETPSGAKIVTVWRDLHYAWRSLLKSPGFLCVVVLSLAIGIAATSTMFSVISAELYSRLPYDDPDRLMVIWEIQQSHPDSEEGPPIAESVDWNRQNHVFEDIALTSSTESAPMSGAAEPGFIRQQFVTPNFFRVLRVAPAFGRVFSKQEVSDTSQSIVISDSFWKSRFKGAHDAIGKSFDISSVESTVVGIMPPRFTPFYGENIDAWSPINPESPRYSERKDRGWLMPVGRLKAGRTVTQAQTEMNLIAQRLEKAYPASNKGFRTKVVPLHEEVSGWARLFYPFVGAVAFVLLIACLNIANLLQSRTETRRREQALRASLGASRLRLIRQLLAESLLLAFMGGVVGSGLTLLGIRVFITLAQDYPNTATIGIDRRVLLFTLGLSCATAILFGSGPALRASNPDLNAVMQRGGVRVAGTRGWTRHLLVVSEIALAMVLLAGAGLMINSVLRLQQVKPGVDTNHVMLARIALPEGGKYVERVPGGDMERTTPLVTAFYRRLLEKIGSVPGVESTGIASQNMRGITFAILGEPGVAQEKRPEANYAEVSATYFDTLRIPLKRGRLLTEQDRENAPWTAIVNEAFARRYFPNGDPIGQRLLLRYENYHIDEERPREIIGVVGDVKYFGLQENPPAIVYAAFVQQPAVFPGGCTLLHIAQSVVVRVAPGSRIAGDFASAIKKAVEGIDRDQAVSGIMTLKDYFDHSIDDSRFIMKLLEIFAGMALLLAAVGIYGVMSYFVNERTHEIGIRIALGANRANVVGLVSKLGLKLTAIGIGTGTAMAVGLTRLIRQYLYGVSAFDPTTFAVVALVLVSIGLLACVVPALRATRTDPMVALRHN